MTKFKQMLVAMVMPAMLFTGLAASTEPAGAVVYCTYIGYPAACVVRPGVRLVARPVGVGHVGGAHVGNRNGGVNRVGVPGKAGWVKPRPTRPRRASSRRRITTPDSDVLKSIVVSRST